MKTVIHKRGFTQELWTVVEKLAGAGNLNVNDIWLSLFETDSIENGGVFLDWDGAAYDDALEVSVNTGAATVTIKKGRGLAPGHGFIDDLIRLFKITADETHDIDDIRTNPLPPTPPTVGDYYLWLVFDDSYSDAVPYDKTYATNGYTIYDGAYHFDIRLTGTSPVTGIKLAKLNYSMLGEWTVAADEREPVRMKNIVIPESVFQTPPVVPTHLRATTGFDAMWRNDYNGAAPATIPGVRPPGTLRAYAKLKFGDSGTGAVSGSGGGFIIWTKAATDLVWVVDEWIGQTFTDSNGNSWVVVDNDVTTLTVADDGVRVPEDGQFWLGPNAKGYRYDIDVLIPIDPPEHWKYQQEVEIAESPTKMEIVIHGLEPNTTYQFKVASLAGWNQEEQSAWSSAVTITAGGTKAIPESCADALEGGAIVIETVDSGVRLTWDIKSAYEDAVAGLELAWTDDGSAPDFDSPPVGQYYGVAQKSPTILTSRLSTTSNQRVLRFISRLVDHAGRHCTTPYVSVATVLNQGVQSVYQELVAARTDHRGVVYATLQNRLLASLGALGYEMEALRAGYSSAAARMDAVQRGVVDWGFTRIVAKSGGQFTSIQAAIDSIAETETNAYTIQIYQGEYSEAGGKITVANGKKIHIQGMGSVSIKDTRLVADAATGGQILSVCDVAFNYTDTNSVEDLPIVGIASTNSNVTFHNVDVYLSATVVNSGGMIEIAGTHNQIVFDGIRFTEVAAGEPYGENVDCVRFLHDDEQGSPIETDIDTVLFTNPYLYSSNGYCIDSSAVANTKLARITLMATQARAADDSYCIRGSAGQIIAHYSGFGYKCANGIVTGGSIESCELPCEMTTFPLLKPLQGQQ